MLRHAAFLFAGLAALAGAAFWPSYFSRFASVPVEVHLHGVAMTAWCPMLVAQATLIRTGRRDAHRALGRLSYVLVPLIVLATLALAQFVLRNAKKPFTPEVLYFFYLQISLTAVLAFAYVQAMRHRARPAVHGTYMVATGLALVDPVVGRLAFYVFGWEPPATELLAFALVDVVLVALLIDGRRSPERRRAALVLLAVFVIAQVPAFFLPGTSAWRAAAGAFAGL
jgi:hypothetical protein